MKAGEQAAQAPPLEQRLREAMALHENGQCQAAARVLDELLQQPEHSAAGWLVIGNLAEALGRAADASQAWRTAEHMDPAAKSSHYQMGCERFAQQRYLQASLHFRHCTRLDPNSVLFRQSLVNALGRVPVSPNNRPLEQELGRCLADERVDPNRLRHAVSQHLLHKPGIRRLIAHAPPAQH